VLSVDESIATLLPVSFFWIERFASADCRDHDADYKSARNRGPFVIPSQTFTPPFPPASPLFMPSVQLARTVGIVHSAMRLGATFRSHASDTGEPVDSPDLWWKLGVSAVLILLGGVFAGYVHVVFPIFLSLDALNISLTGDSLTLGLMGLDELNLRVLSAASDDEVEKKNAGIVRICSVIIETDLMCKTLQVLRLLHGRRHWLLVVSTVLDQC
jgi:hypothetical protein